jgi:DNA-binding beta-propeller fold protein YncE
LTWKVRCTNNAGVACKASGRTSHGEYVNRKFGLLFVPLAAVAIGTFSLFARSKATEKHDVLRAVADVLLPGPPVRFDYQSFNPADGLLYIAHMNADQLVVFDTRSRQIIANLDGFHQIHGVIAVPELGKIFASATGDHQVLVVDAATLKTIAKVGEIKYPDGLAYAPTVQRVFVSDEHGNADAVINTTSNTIAASIALGGGAGNTVYDSKADRIYVAVHGKNELVTIDPLHAKITTRTPLTDLDDPHGIALDQENRLAFVAGEGNSKLVVVDLNNMRPGPPFPVGRDPDVLAFDSGTKRLYVAAESGNIRVFQEANRTLEQIAELHLSHGHTVAVDPRTHLVYFPLEDLNGKPVLRIMDWDRGTR